MSEFIAGVEEIEHIDKALDLLQKRELSLKREILYLQEEREALLIIRRLATSSIAPVHRLPDEVLGEIFVAGTFGPSDDDEADEFASLVMKICHRWHNVVISTPAVWSRVNLTSSSVRTLQARLLRSKTVDLDIFGEWGALDPVGFFMSAFRKCLPYMSRWRSLSLRFAGLTPLRDFFEVQRACVGVASSLRNLSLTLRSNTSISYSPFGLMLTMPILRRIELIGIDLDWRSLSAASHVSIPRPPFSTQWARLASVRRLHLTSEIDFLINESPQNPPLLRALEHLTVLRGTLGAVLQISMPSLQTLIVERGTTVGPVSWEFQLRPYPQLNALLRLIFKSHYPTPAPFLFHILKRMRALDTLTFVGDCPNDEFFYGMAGHSVSKDPICPQLKNLSILEAHRDPSDAVEVFIQTRSRGLPGHLKGWYFALDPRARPRVLDEDSDSEYDSDNE